MMPEMQLDAVEARPPEHPGSGRELADHVVEFGGRHGLHRGARDRARPGRADDPLAAHHADGAGMAELGGDSRALAVHHLGDPRQPVGGGVVDIDLGGCPHAVS